MKNIANLFTLLLVIGIGIYQANSTDDFYQKMKNKIIQMFLLGLLSACSGNNKNSIGTIIPLNCDVHKVEISLDETYYDSIISHISDTSFVILNERNDIMFSCADKIIEYNNKYYILDQSSLRTVVSFKKDGTSDTKYGRVGQGPGEYVFPWDMDVDETGVYVLDTNSKKVIHYNESGNLIGEWKIPFWADAIKRLKNGNFIFNTTPDGTQVPSLIYTDSLMNPIQHSMPYFVNNPIHVADSVWIGLIEDGHNQYTIAFNPFNNKCGAKKFTKASSIYDIIEPMFSDNKGTIVSLISGELAGMCRDYELLPDTIIDALNDGNRVLLINKFHF